MPIHHPGTGALWPLVKRLMDIILASLGLLFLIPLLPFIALAIYLESPGPIFYRQARVGKGGRIFRVYKFRSMVPDAEKGRAVWAEEDDPRVTRVGRILRRTHVAARLLAWFEAPLSASWEASERAGTSSPNSSTSFA
jgi:lipopolysaccharide/colanic/teichoic acid biosynthesis glycosyltransferase